MKALRSYTHLSSRYLSIFFKKNGKLEKKNQKKLVLFSKQALWTRYLSDSQKTVLQAHLNPFKYKITSSKSIMSWIPQKISVDRRGEAFLPNCSMLFLAFPFHWEFQGIFWTALGEGNPGEIHHGIQHIITFFPRMTFTLWNTATSKQLSKQNLWTVIQTKS